MRKLMAAASLAMLVAAPASAQDLVIQNVTVIDPETGSVAPGRDVLIDDGRITAVLPAEGREADQVIDATGQFLIPGLMDMHSHSSFLIVHDQTLKLMHANGVTGVREMGSDCRAGSMSMCLSAMKASRQMIEDGELVGPRLLELSTTKIGQRRSPAESEEELFFRPANEEQARATVQFMVDRGAEILKINQGWQPDVFMAFMDAAKEAGIKVGGHIPMWTSSADAARIGITSIEHARDLPMDCARVGAEMRELLRRKLEGEDLPWPDRRSIPGRSVAEFDAELCDAQVKTMAEHGIYYVPTHLTREMDYRAVEDEYRDDPRLKYIPPMQQDNWNEDLDRTASAPPELIEDLAGFFKLGLKTTGIAHKAGVKVMLGTDANDTMVFPGFSLHDELKHLVAAGLSPMEALQAGTSVPAIYLGREDDLGGISAGKLADLVLLSANPIADIDNSDTIVAVIQGGRVSDRASLDAMLENVAVQNAKLVRPNEEETEEE